MKMFQTGLIFATLFTASTGMAKVWGFCNEAEKLAYADQLFQSRKPQADFICRLNTAVETGYLLENRKRCDLSMAELCTPDGGGNLTAGQAVGESNDIPRAAWYRLGPQETGPLGEIRCDCGCFIGSVKILTASGWQTIADLASKTASLKPRLAIPREPFASSFEASAQLNANAFTVGPEEALLIELATDNGAALTLTGTHPVVIVRDGRQEMVKASEVVKGSVLLTTEGSEVVVITARSFKPGNAPLVYNVDTMGHGGEAHVIVANGLRMGDLAWQRQLSETSSREANLLKYAKNSAN